MNDLALDLLGLAAALAGGLLAWLFHRGAYRRLDAAEQQRAAALLVRLEAAVEALPSLPPEAWTDASVEPRIPVAAIRPLPPCLRYRGDLLLLRPRRRP